MGVIGAAGFATTSSSSAAIRAHGASGTVTFNLTGSANPGTAADTLAYQATDVIVSGTGALANLHGVIKQVGADHRRGRHRTAIQYPRVRGNLQ